MKASIPERHSAGVPDQFEVRHRAFQSPAEDDWAAREKKRYAGRRLVAALPNGDPPSVMLWGEDT